MVGSGAISELQGRWINPELSLCGVGMSDVSEFGEFSVSQKTQMGYFKLPKV